MTSITNENESSPKLQKLARNPSFNPNEYESNMILNANDTACDAETESYSPRDTKHVGYNTA